MTQRWLKHADDGYIFGWTSDLSRNPKLFEVTEEEAFPERSVPKELVKKTRAKRTTGLDISTDDIPEEPKYTSPEIEADASRDLPE